MLCSHQYTKAIDIWSAGCSFGELLSKKYLFPGENYLNQIKIIIEVLGSIDDKDLGFIQNDHAKNYVKSFKNMPKKNLKEVLNYDDDQAIDLLSKMIVYDPYKRISAKQALNHPYFDDLYKSTFY